MGRMPMLREMQRRRSNSSSCHNLAIPAIEGYTSEMPTKLPTMNVSLTPELEKLVQSKIRSGRYQSASEVMREALRLLEQRDQERAEALGAVREKLRVGYEQLKRGEGLDGEKVFEEIFKLSRSRRKR